MFEINTLIFILYALINLGLFTLMFFYILKGYKKHRALQKRQSFKLIKGENVE